MTFFPVCKVFFGIFVSVLTSHLLNHHIDLVTVLHVQFFRGLGLVKSFTIEKETNVVDWELN